MRALLVLCLLAAGCGRGSGERHGQTKRERDSVIGASQLPGAAGVRRAIEAADSAAARNARLDSVGR